MKKTEESALVIDNVSKEFSLPHQKADSVKSVFLNPFKRYNKEKQKALSNVSFDIKKGEFFGIVGKNGSGKSTLLKCIAGVYKPTHGKIKINGSLVPFIELGVGFNSDLSGRDNVYLNGAMLGFSREEMDEMYDEIVEFAELERFMDQKLKNYSSGMQVRLAFSIAIRAETDILLLDEVLAVGDSAFKKKCNDYFYDLKEKKKTIILVTHSMGYVEQYCDRAMLVNDGEVLKIGSPLEIADMYNDINFSQSDAAMKKMNDKKQNENKAEEIEADRKATIHEVSTFDTKTNKDKYKFKPGDIIGVRYKIKINDPIESPTVGLVFRDSKGGRIFATNTVVNDLKLRNVKPGEELTVEFKVDNVFENMAYSISGAIASKDRIQIYHRLVDTHVFEVNGFRMTNSRVNPNHSIDVTYTK